MRDRRQIQRHHTQYADPERNIPEIVRHVFKGEHNILGWLSRMKNKPSHTFLYKLHDFANGPVSWTCYTEEEMKARYEEDKFKAALRDLMVPDVFKGRLKRRRKKAS